MQPVRHLASPEAAVHAQQPPRVPSLCMSTGGDASSGSWLEGPARKLQGLQEGSLVVAGEALRVSVPLHNPMAVVLHISRLRVACQHAAAPGSADPPDAFVQVLRRALQRHLDLGAGLFQAA